MSPSNYPPGVSGNEPQITGEDEPEWEEVGMCPACGQSTDHCLGHGAMGDIDGHLALYFHDRGIHHRCHPAGCEEAVNDQAH